MIDINQFCSKDQTRTNLLKPFNYGKDEVAATSGYASIIIKGRGVDSEIEQAFSKIHENVKLVGEEEVRNFANMKREICNHEFDKRPCPYCKGTGELSESKYCEDYDGNGEWIDVSCECPMCEEWEDIGCKKCKGLNFIYETELIEVCGINIKSEYAYLLKSVGDITFQLAEDRRRVFYKFDGGRGLIMRNLGNAGV